MNDLYRAVSYELAPKMSIDDFSVELQFEFTDLDSAAIPYYIRKSAIRLCRESNVLRRKANIRIQGRIENYILEPEDCTDIVGIMGICKLCGNMCGEVTRLTHKPCRMSCGTVSWFESPNVIWFSKPPCNTVYQVDMSVAPKSDACEIDTELFDKYLDVILDGARASLYGMTGKPWSSVQRAQEAMHKYQVGINRSSVERLTGGQRGAIHIKRPRVI